MVKKTAAIKNHGVDFLRERAFGNGFSHRLCVYAICRHFVFPSKRILEARRSSNGFPGIVIHKLRINMLSRKNESTNAAVARCLQLFFGSADGHARARLYE